MLQTIHLSRCPALEGPNLVSTRLRAFVARDGREVSHLTERDTVLNMAPRQRQGGLLGNVNSQRKVRHAPKLHAAGHRTVVPIVPATIPLRIAVPECQRNMPEVVSSNTMVRHAPKTHVAGHRTVAPIVPATSRLSISIQGSNANISRTAYSAPQKLEAAHVSA